MHGQSYFKWIGRKKPETVDATTLVPRMQDILTTQQLCLAGTHPISFNPQTDFPFHQKEVLPKHSNGMRFSAYDATEALVCSQIYYSIGGGFIITAEEAENPPSVTTLPPYPFSSAKELLALCETHQLSIAELVMANESHWRSPAEVKKGIKAIAGVMLQCIEKGCQTHGLLPGG